MVKAFKKKKKCEKTTKKKKKERNVYGHEGVLKIASIGITPWNIECRQFSLGPCPPKAYIRTEKAAVSGGMEWRIGPRVTMVK